MKFTVNDDCRHRTAGQSQGGGFGGAADIIDRASSSSRSLQCNRAMVDHQGVKLHLSTLHTTLRTRHERQADVTIPNGDTHLIVRRTIVTTSVVICLAIASIAAGAESACKMLQIVELPVRVVKNKLIVDGAVNGQKIGIVLDTGTTTTLMLRQATERLGLERREARGYRVFGMGGETTAESVLIDDFRLGQASRKGWRMLVAGEHDFGDEAAVLLGEDFFDHVDVEFDLAHNVVRLFQPKNCDGISLAYWATEERREVAIDAIYDARPQILLTVQINGQPVRAMLDSGAGGSILSTGDAARLGVTPETPGVVAVQSGQGLGPKQFNVWIGPFDRLVIGNEIIDHPYIPFGDLYKAETYTSTGSRLAKNVSQEQPMLLGADFLRAHRVLVSHSQRKIYFTYLGGPMFAMPRPPQSGAEPHPDKDTPPKSGEK
jgi:predicted aspartyl protease